MYTINKELSAEPLRLIIQENKSNAAIISSIKRDNDQFIFEPYYKVYKDIMELENDY